MLVLRLWSLSERLHLSAPKACLAALWRLLLLDHKGVTYLAVSLVVACLHVGNLLLLLVRGRLLVVSITTVHWAHHLLAMVWWGNRPVRSWLRLLQKLLIFIKLGQDGAQQVLMM